MTVSIIIIGIGIAYAIFWLWYTGLQRPLSQQEIEAYMAKLQAMENDEIVIARIHKFMQRDTGKGFVMVNLLHLHRTEPGAEPASKTLEKYSKVFLGRLLRRAGHPIATGRVAAEAVELWGLEDAAKWTAVGMIRYRSRRDLLEMIVDPSFSDVHPFKEEALKKTIAVPVDPWFSFADVRLLVGLLAIILALVIIIL